MAEGSSSIVEFPGSGQVAMNNGKEKHPYAFDHAFSADAPQEHVYKELGIALLDKAFDGFNSTIFAYGQTGSGKTHTMLSHRAAEEERGLIPRIADELYLRIDKITAEIESRKFLVCCSFLEIYNEVIYDLLVPRNKQSKGGLEVREQKGIGVYVKDLTEMVIESSKKLNQIIEQGFAHRSTAATKMNDASSRSHCMFVVKLHQKDSVNESKNTFSKLNLVDLAGSERAKSTEAEGDRLKEGANINKSLSALGNVINALSSIASGSKKVFVPYRNSKLTRVLQESLGGNSLCTMVATISPSSTSWEETLSTLNYAKRAKTIKVTAVRNDEASQIKKLEDEVNTLRRKLEQQVGVSDMGMNVKEKEELESKYESQITDLQTFMQQSWEEKQRLSEQYEEDQKKVKEEAQKAADRVKGERKRRLQLMEESGDIPMIVQAINAIGSKLVKGWPERISDAMKVEQQLRSQLHAVKLYRESAAADFKMCTGCGVGDPVAMMTLLHQVHGKLGSMTNELEVLKKLEAQFEEQMGRITPEVALAVKETQAALAKASGEELTQLEELLELLTLVGRQLGRHQAKVRSFGREEKRKLEFDGEITWLLQCLTEDGASSNEDRAALLSSLKDASSRAREAAAAPPVELSPSDSQHCLPQVLGLSTLEFPDDKLGASSNAEAARSARLHQAMAYAGWCPDSDNPNEYLEIDLGEERNVTGVSIQGRLPCTSEWSQTRDLLQMALAGSADKLPTAEKVFKRPPVRLIHDVTVALANEHGCFGSGDASWQVPAELLNYADLSREQKVTFFEELIQRTGAAWAAAKAEGLKELEVTPQEILTGKSCEETNRLLQLLALLGLKVQRPNMGGLLDAVPQWIEKWTLSYFQGSDWTKVVAAKGSEMPHVFDGNTDESTPKFVTLPSALKASKLRLHPVAWHCHPAMRLEIHTGSGSAPSPASPSRSQGGGSSLEVGVQLTRKGMLEVQRGIEERQQTKQKEEEAKAAEVNALKDKAEQERDLLEKRLKDALQKVEELEAARTASEQRAVTAETTLLQMQVERDRLASQVEQLETDLADRTEAKDQAEEQVRQLRTENEENSRTAEDISLELKVMKEERDLARNKEEELFDMLTMKEEELMDTNNGYVYLTERLQEKEEEMENENEKVDALQDANEKLDQRCKELQDETLTLRMEQQKLKTKLAEEERMHKAAQDRYMKMLKDGMGGGSRPETGSTAPEPPNPKDRVLMNSTPNSAGSYEEDFDAE
jgi:hypothetical protein